MKHKGNRLGFAGQIRDARRVAGFLTDALVLNNAQQHAILAYTITLRQELALAATEAQAALAQQEYLLAMRRVLATSQVEAYAALVERCTGTMQPLLDNVELAAR